MIFFPLKMNLNRIPCCLYVRFKYLQLREGAMEHHSSLPQGQMGPLSESLQTAQIVNVVRLQLRSLPGLDELLSSLLIQCKDDETSDSCKRLLNYLTNAGIVEDRRCLDYVLYRSKAKE